jgi:hypothetical protein
MALLEQVFSAYRRKVPHMLVFELEVFETDAATVRWTLAETQDRKDHTAACEHLRDLTKAGIAQSMHQIRLETRPGQRAVSEAGSDEGGAGGIVTMTESSRGGARLMVEAEADPGEADIALKLDLRLQCGPEGRMGAGAPAGTDRDVRLVTSTAMGAGTTRMIAVWTSPRSLSRQMQTAFLRAEMVPSLPLENTRLAALVERFTEPLATVVATAGTRNEPALETRVIRMKPEFFPMRIGFTSEAVLETLSYHGIAFPEGARVDYVNSVSLLVAKNAPGNLDAIQRFTEGMSSHLNKVVNVTLEIVEGDAHTMRGMVEKSRGVADHRALWSEVESLVELERVKLLRTARLEVRHGEKGWFAVGEECAEPERARGDMLSGRRARTTVHAVRLGSGNGVAKSSSGDGNKGGRNGSHAWILTAPSRLIGTWLEVAPVVNGPNMDVELEFEHHYAAPTGQAVKQGGTKNGNGNGNGNERDVEMTNYSRFRSSSSITARSGMIRLVGVWAAGDMSRTPGPATMQAAFLRVDMAWMKSGERS